MSARSSIRFVVVASQLALFASTLNAQLRPGDFDVPDGKIESMAGSNLTVMADQQKIWEGDLGPVALEFDGPVGLRSDNARVVFDFRVNK